MADESDLWECTECQQENAAEDAQCCACDAPRPAPAKYAGFRVGLVTAVEQIPKMAKLKAVTVSFGGEETVTVVTNAKNIDAPGVRVVVATVGATVVVDGEEVEVKKSVVGGRKSEGMLCDGAMLGWKGGGAGTAVTLDETHALGGPPPETRPRGAGK